MQIFLIFLRLGLTSFGGPIAHLAYFRDMFVEKKQWLKDEEYAQLVALCQFLPGPSSSQVGFAVGWLKGGLAGGLMAWLGFTLPSAIIMLVAAGLFVGFAGENAPWLHGMKIVAVAIVAQAIWAMAKTLCPDKQRLTVAFISAILLLLMPHVLTQPVIIVIAAIIGFIFLKDTQINNKLSLDFEAKMSHAFIALSLFLILLIGFPIASSLFQNTALQVADSFYRAGSLVFGGGHVVLPLLQAEVVESHNFVSQELFLAGYGAAQALPGPLFTFAAYLGSVVNSGAGGVLVGLLALIMIFLPGMLLVIAILPFWQQLSHYQAAQAALRGINAAVVGFLIAAFYQPIFISTIHHAQDMVLALLAFGLLIWKVPPWLVLIIIALLTYLR